MLIRRIETAVLLAIICMFFTISCSSDDNSTTDGDLDKQTDGDLDIEDAESEVSEEDIEIDGDKTDSEATEDSEIEDEAEEEFEYPTQPENRVVFDLNGPTTMATKENYNRLPFPYDYFTIEDETTRTGKRLNLGKTSGASYSEFAIYNTNLIDRGIFLLSKNEDILLDALNNMDGFAGFGTLYVEVEPDIDENMLPATPEDSIEDESLVFVVNINTESNDFGKKVPVWVKKRRAYELINGVEYDENDTSSFTHKYWYLEIRPYTTFEELTTYALVIKKGLKTPDGDLLESSIDFRVVSGLYPSSNLLKNHNHLEPEIARYKSVIDTLGSDEIAVTAEDLLVAVDFSTQSIRDDLIYVEEKYRNEELVSPDPVFTDIKVDDLSDSKISTGTAHVGAVIRGTFKAADFRLPRDNQDNPLHKRAIAYDENNNPLAQENVDVPFILVLPEDASKQPFPVVLAQHGIYSSKTSVLSLASQCAEKGYATLSMDFIYHGDREDENETMPPLEFIDVAFPLKTRSSFLQSSMDHYQLIHMVKTWNKYSSVNDVYPKGGDGTTDLSTEKIAYIAHSLGSIVGAATVAVSRELDAAVINVGGGGLTDFLQGFLTYYGLASVYPQYYFSQYSTAIQTVIDAGDSVNFASMLNNGNVNQKNVLIQESINDETVPNAVTDNYAKAASVPHMLPVFNEVHGLEQANGPVSNFGYQQFHPACHDTMSHKSCPEGFEGDTESSYYSMRDQILYFLETYMETGTAEIKVPLHAEADKKQEYR